MALDKSDFSFHDMVVLLTGASGGLGSSLARRLSARGAYLIVSSRSQDALDALIESLPHPEKCTALTADLARPGEAERLAAEALAVHGRVDLLLNNAGLGYFALMEEAESEWIRWLFELNTISPLILARELLPRMKAQGSGRVVNIVSCAGRIPIPTNAIYGGSKSALAIMANTMRLEVESYGIDIINIYPGTIDTSFEENAVRARGRDRLCPLDHCGRPREEIAEKVMEAARGPAGEVWLEKGSRWKAVESLVLPRRIDRRMKELLDRTVDLSHKFKPAEARFWRFWQIEASIGCNFRCVMCPWEEYRDKASGDRLLSREVWEAIKPHLPEVGSVDLSGGGESLLNPMLVEMAGDCTDAGCETGFLTNGLLLDRGKSAELIAAGLDWIAFSIDGATEEIYEQIRPGGDFKRLCSNIVDISSMRRQGKPRIIVNFVMMEINFHQIRDMVRLAADLGVDQINFKQCDVIRGDAGRGYGLFSSSENRETRKYQKEIVRARRLARRLGVTTSAFSFIPEEQPVCGQDPRNSLYIRYDGRVSPCVNLAYGGHTQFLGREVTMPTVHYGGLPESDIRDLWETETCRYYRNIFRQRNDSYSSALTSVADFEKSVANLKRVLDEARDSMPVAPEGCNVCHYLYGV